MGERGGCAVLPLVIPQTAAAGWRAGAAGEVINLRRRGSHECYCLCLALRRLREARLPP